MYRMYRICLIIVSSIASLYAAYNLWHDTSSALWWIIFLLSIAVILYILYTIIRHKRLTFRFSGKRKVEDVDIPPPQVLYVCATRHTARLEVPKFQQQLHRILNVEEYEARFMGESDLKDEEEEEDEEEEDEEEEEENFCVSRIQNPELLSTCGYDSGFFDAVLFELCPVSVLEDPLTLLNVSTLLKDDGVLIVPRIDKPNREVANQEFVNHVEEHGFKLADVVVSTKAVGGWNMYVFSKRLE